MSIRQTLLIAFLMFSVVAAAAMMILTYSRSRTALSNEIRLNLQTQATTTMEQIESTIFERVENIHGWSRLDLMQEIKVDDVDKRLARFLRDIKAAYAGIYNDLFCVRDELIIAASDASLIAAHRPAPSWWLEIPILGSTVHLSRPVVTASPSVLTLQAPVQDAFTREDLGEIYAEYDWSDVAALLDYAVANSPRMALLLDADGRPLAASATLRAQPGLATLVLNDWIASDSSHEVSSVRGTPLHAGELLIGQANAAGYKGLPALGWRVLILVPEELAFGPVTHLLKDLSAVLILIVIIAVISAIRISGRLARPLQALTTATREAGLNLDISPVPLAGTSEVAELSRAFTRMVEDLRHSRQDLVRVSKLAAVGEMAAMLAHEVRNPLGIMRSSAQLLKRQQTLDERGHEMLDFMLHECDRINDLVTGLLENARPRPPVLASHDLGELVQGLRNLLVAKAEKKQIALDFVPPLSPVVLECDQDQMLQVVLNLLLNAIQMTPAGGHVELRLGQGQQEVWIDVADDGPGIPRDERTRVLEPFVSTRDGGIGLGLAIVQDIVQRHGGEIIIDDGPLGGTRFRIRLPRSTEEKLA